MTFTKEWLQHQIAEFESCAERTDGYRLDEGGKNTLAALKLALAGMEAEPVYQMRLLDGSPEENLWVEVTAEEFNLPLKDPSEWDKRILYTAPQPLTTSERAELENYRNAQQVVPEWTNEQCLEFLSIAFRHAEIKGDLEMDDIRLGVKMVNACRAAMLQGKADAGERLGTQFEEVLIQAIDASMQPGNSPVIPGCWCRTCRPVKMNDMRFVVCPGCGNKRCPHANDHRNLCTGSNEPGQEGSAYPAEPQQEADNG